MKLSRETEIKIKYILEQIIPPIIRDAKWFNTIPFKLLFKDKSDIFLKFKQNGFSLSPAQFSKTYEDVDTVIFTKETDLNKQCVIKILNTIVGTTVLEVGCGKGYLAKKISQKKGKKITAVDIVIEPDLKKQNPKIKFKTANIELLPFRNKSFDTVISTHTLEHVQDLFQSISELRRVTKKRLIIIVPKERPYKYTFNLHLHFFPYPHSLLALMGPNKNNRCEEVGGDLFYVEEMDK